ncbi:MAG: SRPBCC family protein [Methylocella sp.]
MNNAVEQSVIRKIVVDEVLPHTPEVIWKTLTSAELIGRWLMPNNFDPTVGKPFTFQAQPIGDWNGLVDCQVLEVIPNERLAYSWKGGSDSNDKYGSRLDSVVTWTLAVVESGTRLRLVHSGFRSPQNDFAFDAMSGGWANVMQSIKRVATEAT